MSKTKLLDSTLSHQSVRIRLRQPRTKTADINLCATTPFDGVVERQMYRSISDKSLARGQQ